MNKALYSLVLILFLLDSSKLVAQDNSTDTIPVKEIKKEKVTLYMGTAYAWNLHYFGRTDSLRSNAVVPTAILKLGKHITLNPSVVFVSNTSTPLSYAATIITGAYNFGKQKGFSGNISVDKYFYKDQSLLVKGAQWGQVGASLAHNNKIISTAISTNLALVKNNFDIFAAAGLNKQIRISKAGRTYLIQPIATANFGTQNFSNTRIKNSSLPPILGGGQQTTTEEYKKVSLLSYDFSLAVTYAYKKFIFNVSPGYVIPRNILFQNGNTGGAELAQNSLYCNAVVVYRLTK